MDSETLVFAGFVALMVSVPVLIIWSVHKSHQRMRVNLTALAGRLNLRLHEKPQRFAATERWLEGAPHGRHVRVWSFTTGSGKSRQHWAAAGVQPRRAGAATLRLQPQGFGTKLAEIFGAKEIQVGDERFDAAWFIRTNEPDLLRAALVPEIRERLMAARAAGAGGTFAFEDGLMRYVETGTFASAKTVAHVEAALPALFDLADIIEVLAPAKRADRAR